MIIEAYTHKEQFLAPTWDTGNGAPKQGMNRPRRWSPKKTVKPITLSVFSGAAIAWISDRMLEPHNSRRHCIIKRKHLEELKEIAIKARVFDLGPMGLPDKDLDQMMDALPKLLGTGNNSFKVR